MTDQPEVTPTATAACGEQDWLGDIHEEPIEFTCQRPVGHDAPHRDRSPGDRDSSATAWEWWPEKWWNDDE